MTRPRRLLGVTWLLAASALGGCSETPAVNTSTTEVQVSGVVTVRGAPATGGTIRFNPSNHLRVVPTRTAEIGADGSYSIKTLPGVNAVSFDGEVASRNKGVGLIKEYPDVASGENRFDFDLLGEGAKIPIQAVAQKKGRR
jgi:hypothetical protein